MIFSSSCNSTLGKVEDEKISVEIKSAYYLSFVQSPSPPQLEEIFSLIRFSLEQVWHLHPFPSFNHFFQIVETFFANGHISPKVPLWPL